MVILAIISEPKAGFTDEAGIFGFWSGMASIMYEYSYKIAGT